jgi:hypothetical protein
MFVVAPVVAVGVATAGFVLANHYDAPRPDDGGSPLPALSLHLVGPACSAKLASQLKTGGWADLAEQGNRILMAVLYPAWLRRGLGGAVVTPFKDSSLFRSRPTSDAPLFSAA